MSNNFLQNITPAELAALVNLKPFDEDVFVQSLYADINKAIKHIEKTADKYYSDDEDKSLIYWFYFSKVLGTTHLNKQNLMVPSILQFRIVIRALLGSLKQKRELV